MNIYTIGYEGSQLSDFVSQLKNFEIETLIDVRDFPGSRKFGFSKSQLEKELNSYAINYIHKRELGCPREIRNEYRNDNDWINYSIRFLDYIYTQPNTLNWLANELSRTKCCLMCFERDFSRCHRTHIVNVIAKDFLTNIKQVDITLIKTMESDIPLLVDIPHQLITTDQEIDVESLREKIDLYS